MLLSVRTYSTSRSYGTPLRLPSDPAARGRHRPGTVRGDGAGRGRAGGGAAPLRARPAAWPTPALRDASKACRRAARNARSNCCSAARRTARRPRCLPGVQAASGALRRRPAVAAPVWADSGDATGRAWTRRAWPICGPGWPWPRPIRHPGAAWRASTSTCRSRPRPLATTWGGWCVACCARTRPRPPCRRPCPGRSAPGAEDLSRAGAARADRRGCRLADPRRDHGYWLILPRSPTRPAAGWALLEFPDLRRQWDLAVHLRPCRPRSGACAPCWKSRLARVTAELAAAGGCARPTPRRARRAAGRDRRLAAGTGAARPGRAAGALTRRARTTCARRPCCWRSTPRRPSMRRSTPGGTYRDRWLALTGGGRRGHRRRRARPVAQFGAALAEAGFGRARCAGGGRWPRPCAALLPLAAGAGPADLPGRDRPQAAELALLPAGQPPAPPGRPAARPGPRRQPLPSLPRSRGSARPSPPRRRHERRPPAIGGAVGARRPMTAGMDLLIFDPAGQWTGFVQNARRAGGAARRGGCRGRGNLLAPPLAAIYDDERVRGLGAGVGCAVGRAAGPAHRPAARCAGEPVRGGPVATGPAGAGGGNDHRPDPRRAPRGTAAGRLCHHRRGVARPGRPARRPPVHARSPAARCRAALHRPA